VNTAAVERPELISEIADRAGSQCVVLAIDAAQNEGSLGSWEVVTRSGSQRTGIDVCEWSQTGAGLGAGEILLTSFDQDGVGNGYDLALMRTVAGAVRVPIIASGGASSAKHMHEALEAGADAVLAASIFHDGVTGVRDIKLALREMGQEVRL